MLFDHDIKAWNGIVSQSYDIEFDFLALDAKNQIAVFSTFNRGYRPECVTSSYSQYLLLDKFLDTLPKTTNALAAIQSKNLASYTCWKNYAELGFFAYDNQDVHRKEKDKKLQYDILFKPGRPGLLEELEGLREYLTVIPKFDLVFGDNIKFEMLETSLLI